MYIHKRLLIVGGLLLAAALACDVGTPQNSPEVQEIYEAYSRCISDIKSITEGDVHQECVSFLDPEQLELLSLHSRCQDGKCAETVNAKIDAELGELLCDGLTPEECVNVGQHFYDEQLTSAEPAECDTFEWPDNFAIQHISFENDRAILERWSSNEGYDGHVRVAPNTYQLNDSALVRTIIFSADGYQQLDYQELNDCTWTYTFTLNE